MSQPASAAYRADLGGRDQPFGPADGDWIAVASVLEHAALVSEPARSDLLRDAVELATEIVGENQVSHLAHREWQDRDRSPSEAILILADQIHTVGAFHLAGAILDSFLEADSSLNVVQRGRTLAKRARIEWKMGRLDDAADRYRHIESLGRRFKTPELRARAWIGLAALNQMWNDFTAVHRYARRAARLAETEGLLRLAREAHNGLMIAASLSGRHDEALVHGWTVFQLSTGDSHDEAEVLQNLGQILLHLGVVDSARAAFATVASRELPARWILPALGGLALASAASEHDLTTEWAAREVLRVDPLTVPRYVLASALFECAVALTRLGRKKNAARCRDAALELTREYNFRELAAQFAELDETSTSVDVRPKSVLNKRATRVVNALSSMEPRSLPRHISLASA